MSDFWKKFCENETKERLSRLEAEISELKKEAENIDVSEINLKSSEYPKSNDCCPASKR